MNKYVIKVEFRTEFNLEDLKVTVNDERNEDMYQEYLKNLIDHDTNSFVLNGQTIDLNTVESFSFYKAN